VLLAAVAAWKAPGWRNSAATRRGQPVKTSETLGLLRIPGMKEALITSISVLTAIDLLVAYLPVLGEDNGISPAFIGLVLSVQAAAGMVSRLVVARMIRRFGRRPTLIANIAVAGLGLVGLSLIPPQPVLLVLGAVIGFALGLCMPVTTAWVSDRAPDGRIGSALALRLAGNRLGALIAPAGIGLLAGIIGTPAVFMAASLGLFGSAWWMRSAPTGSEDGK
jgi:MFS family permease